MKTKNNHYVSHEDRLKNVKKETVHEEMLKALINADKLLAIYARTTEGSLNGKGVDAEIWQQVKEAIKKAQQ